MSTRILTVVPKCQLDISAVLGLKCLRSKVSVHHCIGSLDATFMQLPGLC